MENVLQILSDNYIWVICAAIFIVFTVIGYFVDRNQTKKRKAKENIEMAFGNKLDIDGIDKEQPKEETEPATPIDVDFDMKTDKKEAKSFLKEDNYDLSSLMKESIEENKESENQPAQTIEPVQENSYDRNLEYLLKEKEQPKEEIESIDDFLQRTMREAYKPSKVDENIEESSTLEKSSNELDYDDTLPIPIQKEEDFSPVEVTVVDPEFYKGHTNTSTEVNTNSEPDFKPIEDAILESLGKLSEKSENTSNE